MMETLNQPETKIASNLDDATQNRQNEDENADDKKLGEIGENEKYKNNLIEGEKNTNINAEEHIDVLKENTKPSNAETLLLNSSYCGSTDHNSKEAVEKETSSIPITDDKLQAAEKPELPDVSVNSEENQVDINLTKLNKDAKHNSPKPPNKIVLVDYDDEDEEELLKSDSEEQEIERDEQLNEANAVKDVVDISLEKEEELLKSDEETEKEFDVETPPKIDETKETVEEISESHENKYKEVVTISDEEDDDEDHTTEKLLEQPTTVEELRVETVSNVVDLAENSTPTNEVINVDDDDSLEHEVKNFSANLNDNECIKNSQIAKTNSADEEKISKHKSPLPQTENKYENEPRLLYKFEIDDSNDSRVSNDYMNEESHDTFASINDDSRNATGDSNQDANLKLLAASAENELEKAKDRAEMEEKENAAVMMMETTTAASTQHELPKLNGDHKLTQETEDEETEKEYKMKLNDRAKEDDSVIAISSDPSSEQTQSSEMLPEEQICADAGNSKDNIFDIKSADEIQNEFKPLESDIEEETQKPESVFNEAPVGCLSATTAQDINVIEDDDDASRCSSLASSVASSATSSSQQLVIDHPMDDLVETKANTNNPENLLVAPLKLTLKRKLSNSSDKSDNCVSMSPVHKHPHLELEDGKEINKIPTNVSPNEPHESEKKTQNHYLPEERQEHANVFVESVPKPPFKSLLLEQLQKPRTPPVPLEPLIPMDTFLMPTVQALPPPPPPPSTVTAVSATKYLCFKCKTGFFDSFAALNEHQLSCLASSMSTMFPPMQPAKAATPPPRPLTPTVEPLPLPEPLQTCIAPVTPPPPKQKARYYKCSTCGTYHEIWNFFLHIREKHNRHMCLYCIRFFPTAEKLSLHLEIKHDLEQNHFNSEEALRHSQRPKDDGIESDVNESETRLLMCCTCQHVFREHEPFSDHICSEYIKPCALCGQKGRHTSNCKAHPDAKRRASKVKKKTTKQKVGAHGSTSVPNIDTQSLKSSSQPPTAAASHTLSYCDNKIQQRSSNVSNSSYTNFGLRPSSTNDATLMPHSEDSNDSSNMVIDESCTNTTHHSNSLVNPFKVLDERERAAEQQFQAPTTLLPDRLALAAGEEKIEKPIKMKLCVPKKWQKPVGAVISSTDESEEEEEEGGDEEHSPTTEENKSTESPSEPSFASHGVDDIKVSTIQSSALNCSIINSEDAERNRQTLAAEDDESLEEPPNSNMQRLLAEIERTQLAIQHTKESLHHTPKVPSSSGSTPRQATLSQSSNRTAERNWSPTPPASPNSRWSHAEHQQSKLTEPLSLLAPQLDELQPPSLPQFLLPPIAAQQLQQQLERRDTVGSDAMDIDDSISGAATASTKMQSPPDNTLQSSNENLDTSTESSAIVDIERNSSIENDVQMSQENAEITPQPMDTDDSLKTPETPGKGVPCSIAAHEAIEQFSYTETTKNEVEDEDDYQEQEIDVCDKPNEQIEATPPKPEPPADGIEVAPDDMRSIDLQLDRPLERFEIVEFVRICLRAAYPQCLYCNHARRIAVNGNKLVLHIIATHRFTATVDSITAEELHSETIVAKLKSFLPALETEYFNSKSYCTIGDGKFSHLFNERIFECFHCRFETTTHKELYLHNRKSHTKDPLFCIMCLAHFYSFSEVLCHICPGERCHTPSSELKYRCCLCDVDNIPSPFRMMVHLRKRHFACDVCLEDCRDQSRLSSHVWKHKLSHLCYRCGIAYRNKMDITKHLFWKHGTESIICKRCMQKRWRHVYHFCVPPPTFVCDVCQLTFSKAVYLKVHKRIHTGDFRYPCTEENCAEKFISRRLLLKHTGAEHPPIELPTPEKLEDAHEINEEKSESMETDESIKQEAPEIKKEIEEDGDAVHSEEKNADEIEPLKQDTESKVELKNEERENSKSVEKQSKTEKKSDETTTTRKKKKKNKRSKESLEDLNLIAPNLSETDSSDDSGTETKSRADEENELVPKVMLSPPSEAENEMETNTAEAAKMGNEADRTGKVLDIWKNFLQSQGDATLTDVVAHCDEKEVVKEANKNEKDILPPSSPKHVGASDHDYCLMTSPPKPPTPSTPKTKVSPSKRKNSSKSPRRTNSAHRGATGKDDSSSSSDDSSTSASCSCSSSNCSCSSDSNSSSSSSSSDSDSSGGSNASRKRCQRKTSERGGQRKKSESISPLKKKQHNHSETLNVDKTDDEKESADKVVERSPSPAKEPLFYESDLETAESDTDEEFYDQHPQQLASVLLAQKRAELMAERRLSPSHNFDIVENSRPSTPSLPEDVAASAGAAHDKKSKIKKRKRERKSTSKSEATTLKYNLAKATAEQQQQQQSHNQTAATALPHFSAPGAVLAPSYDMQSSPSIAEPLIAQQPQPSHHHYQPPPPAEPQMPTRQLGQNHLAMGSCSGRMSEGSSCSDADASLKRSKRVPRPNKFFGFDGEDENNGTSGHGGVGVCTSSQSLMIGMRTFKPQPPPQLVWNKDDLPTPSKSILNNKNKVPRTSKTPASAPPLGGAIGSSHIISSDYRGTPLTSQTKSTKRKRLPQHRNNVTAGGLLEKSMKRNKRPTKKSTASASSTPKQPPIPTLKIRGIGVAGGTNHIPASQIYSSSKESDDDDDSSVDSTSGEENSHPKQQRTLNTNASTSHASSANLWNTTQQIASASVAGPATNSPVVFQAAQVLPPTLPTAAPSQSTPIVLPAAPPTPQASVFNHKIPPALLPNPDFATLQYFKANNIRYPIRPPAGARQPREGESVYCYCRCPYDEVSEMIACDGENCLIEWFHFECVGIMVAPQGKWFCAECRPKYSEELYPNNAGH